MSFLRHTVSSRSRSNATKEELGQRAPGAQPQPPPPPRSRQLFSGGAAPVNSDVTSRAESKLPTRVGVSLPRHTDSRAPNATTTTTPAATSLQEFTAKCDSVMQRAQALLERTRDQEALVAKALEQRLSQSPSRRGTSQPNHTPNRKSGGWLFGSSLSPRVPLAPHTTPVSSLQHMQEQRVSGTPPSPANRRAGLFAFLSPHRSPMPPPPPPTPATALTSPKPSLFERVRHSMQRLSGTLPAAPTSSPVPSLPEPQKPCNHDSTSPARKSVRFVSPDKLESITPTQRRLHQDAADGEGESLLPPRSAVEELHVRFDDEVGGDREAGETGESPALKGRSASPKRSRSRSPTTSPAQSPSPRETTPRRKVPRGEADSDEEEEKQARSHTASPAKATPPPPRKGKAPKLAKKAPTAPSHKAATPTKAKRGGKGRTAATKSTSRQASATRSRSSSLALSTDTTSSSSAATRERHLEMIEFIKSNTVKRSMAAFSKDEMLECLRAEGVAIASREQTKKKLLDELRALLAAK